MSNVNEATIQHLAASVIHLEQERGGVIADLNTPTLVRGVAENTLPRTKTQVAVDAGAVAAGVAGAVAIGSALPVVAGVAGALAFNAVQNDDGEMKELAQRAGAKSVGGFTVGYKAGKAVFGLLGRFRSKKSQ